MTRLPSDSFLPSGAVETDFRRSLNNINNNPTLSSDSSSSGVSPLTISRAPNGYFDLRVNGRGRMPKVNGFPPPSASTTTTTYGSPDPVPTQFLSPHLTPTSTQLQYQIQQQQRRQQQRSASLSPTRKAASAEPGFAMGRTRSAMASPSGGPPASIAMPNDTMCLGARDNGYFLPLASTSSFVPGAEPPRPISVDAAATNAHSTIQHLKQQNKMIREAWENERKYLEANRSRAEDVYKEERMLMDAERSEWHSERASLLERIRMLEDRTGRFGPPNRIEDENISPSKAFRVGAWDGSPDSLRSSRSSQSRAPWNADATQKPPFQAEASPPSTLAVELAHVPGLTRLPPALPPQAAPFINQSQEPHPDFLAHGAMDSPEGSGAPVSSVDVQEIHPELEGIPIKANAIGKPTFDFTSASPPGSKLASGRPSPPIDPVRPALETKTSSREQTLQVLAAKEDQRLTMHAGHTPNHSLSPVPTAAATNAPTTASSSGDSTPKLMAAVDGCNSLPMVDNEGPGVDSEATGTVNVSTAPALRHDNSEAPTEAHPEPTLEPVDDVELKGPLMVRNIPAKDEIFFRRLSEKLQDVAESHDPPTVVKSPSPFLPAPDRPTVAAPGALESGTDSTNDKSGWGSSKGSPIVDDEVEIPLRLKQSHNFGAPFGEVRQTFAFLSLSRPKTTST